MNRSPFGGRHEAMKSVIHGRPISDGRCVAKKRTATLRDWLVSHVEQLHRRTHAASTAAVSDGVCVESRQQFLSATGCDFHGAAGSAAQPSRLGEMLVDLVCQLAREVIAAF
jgi:hypothetical protein